MTGASARSKRTRRRFVAVFATLGVLSSLVFASGSALAGVQPNPFELDGDAFSGTRVAPGPDWNDVYADQLAGARGEDGRYPISGAVSVSWVADPGPSASIFTGGGSKDPIDTDSWAWKNGGGLPDKDNLLHAFAARYSDATSDTCVGRNGECVVLYFGSDRFDNSGDAMQGFWFFQKAVTAASDGFDSGGSPFSGQHTRGDVLVITDFSNGGATSTISVLQWNPECVRLGVPFPGCADTNLEALESSNAANCANKSATTSFCGIVNANDGTPAPWSFTDKKGKTSYRTNEFFEGGINLSYLGLQDRCFSSFLSETRSSTSTSATLKDFIIGTFEKCETEVKTNAQVGSGDPLTYADITGPLSISDGSLTVRDRAHVRVKNAGDWSGVLDFYLCGPTPDITTCTSAAGHKIDSVSVSDGTAGVTVYSAPTTVTAAGRYCWSAHFASDIQGIPDAWDDGTNECFDVMPRDPAISTIATGTVEIGQQIVDVASLSGTSHRPDGSPAGGTITFRVYGPNSANCELTAWTSSPIAVTGDGDYSSGAWTPTSVGTYRWRAFYSGDAPNSMPVAGNCNDANETTTVTPRTPTISTNATPSVSIGSAISDVAHLSGTARRPDGSPAGGTITFRVYGPNSANCELTAWTSSPIAVTGDGDYSSGAWTPTSVGTYRWRAFYSGDAPNTLPIAGNCNDADETSGVEPLQPTMTTAQIFLPNDVAHITVGAGGGDLSGGVQFFLYLDDSSCAGAADWSSGVISVASGTGTGRDRYVNSGNTSFLVTADHVLSWLVRYISGTPNHRNVTAVCHAEHSTVTIVNDGTFSSAP